jgi:DNA-dependent RNA polymerase auxiliary subunit epsilon
MFIAPCYSEDGSGFETRREKGTLFAIKDHTGFRAHPAFYRIVYQRSFTRVKWPRREVDRSLYPCAGAKNEWRFSPLFICLHAVERANFNVYIFLDTKSVDKS